MKSGDTFLMPAPGFSTKTPHLWMVVNDPCDEDKTVIIVSITTLRHGVDQTVILQKREHPFLQWPSVVFYADARLIDIRDLDDKLAAGQLQAHQPCSKGLLDNVKAGISASDHTPQKVQRFYEIVKKRKA
jgi:hypothetical protein